MGKIDNIINGWFNLAKKELGTIDPRIEEIGKERMLQCISCTLRDGNLCSKKLQTPAVADFKYIDTNENRIKGELYSGCNCVIYAKVLCLKCQCPIGKWEHIRNYIFKPKPQANPVNQYLHGNKKSLKIK